MRLLIMGPPGAGKGTQAGGIAARYGVPTISTGLMFRRHVEESTEIGREVQRLLDAGMFVPDELTVRLVQERLSDPDAEAGFVLDGFPRTIGQVQALDDMLARQGHRLNAVLSLVVDTDEVVARLLDRGNNQGRSDDKEETIRHRMKVYADETRPLLAAYRERGLLVEVDGEGAVAEVSERIRRQVEAAVSQA